MVGRNRRGWRISLGAMALLGLLMNRGEASPITVQLNTGSSLTASIRFPQLSRSASTSAAISGISQQDYTSGAQAGFGNIIKTLDPSGGQMSLANISNLTVDFEFLGIATFNSLNLKFQLTGPNNSFLSPPPATGQSNIPLTGSALRLESGTAVIAGVGPVLDAFGVHTVNFATTPINFNFPSGTNNRTTLAGVDVSESIPVNLSALIYHDAPSQLDVYLDLVGTLNLSGMASCVLSNLVGDANNDQNVGAADYAIWAATFGQTGSCLPADFDRNGNVGAADYALWAANFGNTGSGASTASVPEPSALALAALGLAIATIWGVRRSR